MSLVETFTQGLFSKAILEYETMISPSADDKVVAAGAYFKIGDLPKSLNLCEEIYNQMFQKNYLYLFLELVHFFLILMSQIQC